MTESSAGDSREIDTKYMMEVGKILRAAAEAVAEGWTELGLLVNQAPNIQGVTTYAIVTWNGQQYDKWMPDEALADLADVLAKWQFSLTQAGHPNWTAMFVGAKSSGGFVWLPDYTPDYGPWRIRGDISNWPTVEQGLKYVS